MSKSTTVVALVVAIVFGAGAIWYATLASDGELDAQAQAILGQVATEQTKETPDAATCRRLLAEIKAHPQRRVDASMVRGEAWLQLALGSTQDALVTLEPNLLLSVTPADQALGVEILRRRHAESGASEQAFRASVLAREHYAATGDVESLFDAWQMAGRGEDVEGMRRAEELAVVLVRDHGSTLFGRLVAVLDASGYPELEAELGEDDGDVELDVAELRRLELEFEDLPEELHISLASKEITSASVDEIAAGERRLDHVLERFPSSLTAKLLRAVCDHRFRRFPEAKARMNWLLEHYPDHHRTEGWKRMLERVEADSIKRI